MKTFEVILTETRVYRVVCRVEAEDADEARQIAEETPPGHEVESEFVDLVGLEINSCKELP